MNKLYNKRYSLMTITVVFTLLFLITMVRADEYWGFDTGKRAVQYYQPSNKTKDDAVLGYSTRVMYSKETGNPYWYLDELKLSLMISLDPDTPDRSINYWIAQDHWTYYIASVKFEIGITQYINLGMMGTIITHLGSGILNPVAIGVSESADPSDQEDLMVDLYEFIMLTLAGIVHPFFEVLEGILTVVDFFVPEGDSFTHGQDTSGGRDWAIYAEDSSDKVTELGLLVYFEPNIDIPRSLSTPYQMYHSVFIGYTIQIKKMGYGSNPWNPMYPIGPLPAYTITSSITITI